MGDPKGMDLARRVMEKQGWTEGKGLGAREHGRADALRPKLKFDTKGIGESGTEFAWWDHAFNQAAGNIEVTEEEEEAGEGKKKKKSKVTITSKGEARKGLISTRPPAVAAKAVFYGSFVKAASLTSVDPDEPRDMSRRLKDDELFKACGGLTGHKAARHGHKLGGKLARVEAADRELAERLGRGVDHHAALRDVEQSSPQKRAANGSDDDDDGEESESDNDDSDDDNIVVYADDSDDDDDDDDDDGDDDDTSAAADAAAADSDSDISDGAAVEELESVLESVKRGLVEDFSEGDLSSASAKTKSKKNKKSKKSKKDAKSSTATAAVTAAADEDEDESNAATEKTVKLLKKEQNKKLKKDQKKKEKKMKKEEKKKRKADEEDEDEDADAGAVGNGNGVSNDHSASAGAGAASKKAKKRKVVVVETAGSEEPNIVEESAGKKSQKKSKKEKKEKKEKFKKKKPFWKKGREKGKGAVVTDDQTA